MRIIPVFGRPLNKVEESGGWEPYLIARGWRPGEKTYFIFDEAQSSYEDFQLWGQIFKELHGYDDRFTIAFASYGSPTSHTRYTNLCHRLAEGLVVPY